jgi:hypothetical protein
MGAIGTGRKKGHAFLSGRRYIAVVADGKVQFWGKRGLDELERQVYDFSMR